MKTQTPLSSDPRRRRGRFLRSLLLSLALLFVPPALPHLLSFRDPGPPARPRTRSSCSREGREDPGGIPSLVRRRGEGTVHPRRRTEGSRRANRARRFTDSRRGPLAHPRGGVVREYARKRLLREIRRGRGEIFLGDPRHLRLPRPRAVLAFRKVLPKDVALSAIRVRPEGGAGAAWRWAETALHRGWKYWDTAFSCAGSSAGIAPTGRRLLSCARRTCPSRYALLRIPVFAGNFRFLQDREGSI